jgi:hypothetical protein
MHIKYSLDNAILGIENTISMLKAEGSSYEGICWVVKSDSQGFIIMFINSSPCSIITLINFCNVETYYYNQSNVCIYINLVFEINLHKFRLKIVLSNQLIDFIVYI